MSAVWTPKAFEPLVDRLKRLGADARVPNVGEDTDAYLANLMGWMLDVTQPNEKARATAYWRKNDPAFRDVPPPAIETAKAHVTEGGRSYKIEGAVQDGQKFLPGEPLPPKDGAT